MRVAGELTYTVCLWVVGKASRCVSCSQHLVVVVPENAGTALVWNLNGRCQRLGYGGSSLESVGFYGNINEGWNECSVELNIPAISNRYG